MLIYLNDFSLELNTLKKIVNMAIIPTMLSELVGTMAVIITCALSVYDASVEAMPSHRDRVITFYATSEYQHTHTKKIVTKKKALSQR